MTRTTRILILTILLALTSGVGSAQILKGAPPFGSYGGGPETINLANLNSQIKIPVLHKAGRGIPFDYELSYDSSVWYPVGTVGSQVWTPASGWGWLGTAPTGPAYVSFTLSHFGSRCGQSGSYDDWQYSNFVYHDNFSVPHSFILNMNYFNSPGPPWCPPNGQVPSTTASELAADGSGYTIYVNPAPCCGQPSISGKVVDKDGSTISAPFTIGAPTAGVFSITDRNGNQSTANSSGVFTDTLGVTTVTVSGSGTPASPMKFTYTAPNGQPAAFQANYTQYTVATNFGISGITEYGRTSVPLITSVQLPDGSQYTFAYEQTPSTPVNGACTPLSGTYLGYCVTARVVSITLPTGGQITYAYSGGSNGILSDGSTATLTRTTPDGVWKYAQVKGTGAASTTTITDPLNNETVVQFQGIYETQRQAYQGLHTSGNVLQTANTCYNGAASPCTGTAIQLPITQKTVIPQFGSTGLQCKHVSLYNGYGLLTEQDDYDYASGTPTTILRKNLITYATLNNSISSMPATVKVQDGSGATKSQTTYCYDEGTPSGTTTCAATGSPTATTGTPQHINVTGSRGNATTIAYLTQGANTIGKKLTYYDTGMPKTTTDPNGATTTYNYADATSTCGNAFPTSKTEPVGSMTQSYTWNCTGAVMTQITDENGKNATTAYTDAFFWRPASVTDPTSAVKNLTYATSSPFNWAESKMTFNSGNSVVDVLTTVDGLGRGHLQQKRQGPATSNYDSVETDYDSLGRVSRVTVPYGGISGATCPSGPSCPAATTTYDAISRVSQVSDGGGRTTTNSYSNNDVLVTVGPAPSGESTKRRQLEYDSLGRLTSVCEVTAGTAAWLGGSCAQNLSQTGYWTKYTYDPLGDLLTVTQNAQATSANQQTRTYTFDAMGRLTSEKNPETNQVVTSYTYDTDSTCTPSSSGDLMKRIDAVGNTTCFAYDLLHRVTSVTYPSGPYASSTPTKTFVYDSAIVNAQTMQNAKGRLAEAYTGPSGSKVTDLGFGYTARGETSDVYELTPHSNSAYYHVAQSYWPHGVTYQLSGNITGLPTISYGGTIGSTVGLDGEGRMTQVTAASGQNPVTAVTYNLGSLPTLVTFGSGDSDGFTYDANTFRMTQFKFNVGTSSQSLTGALTWNANATLSQLAITDQFNAADTQTCNYSHDDLVRLVTANCGTAASQTFSYDPFGNINKSGSPNSFQPTYSVATNRMTLLPGNFTPTYDANGNVTNDSNHTYSWDTEGNSITVDSVGLTYDALHRMVEQNRSGTYTEIVYSPSGSKLALMGGTGGQTLQKAFVPLPRQATAIYTSSGLDHFRHADWLGSARLTSTTTRSASSTVAYAPFGETYAQFGTSDLSFTGQNSDTVSGDYDFLYRQYSTQGRWPSTDPAGLKAATLMFPQSWNRYAYVLNSPLSSVDPLGFECVWDDGSFDAEDDPSTGGENGVSNCQAAGGTWIELGFGGNWSATNNPLLEQLVGAIHDGTVSFVPAMGLDGSLYGTAYNQNGTVSWTEVGGWINTYSYGPQSPYGKKEGDGYQDPTNGAFLSWAWKLVLATGSAIPATMGTADANSVALALALGNSGVYSLGNACTPALWYWGAGSLIIKIPEVPMVSTAMGFLGFATVGDQIQRNVQSLCTRFGE